MKNNIKIVIVAICTTFIASCHSFEDEPTISSGEEPKVVEVLPNSIKDQMIKQDSLNQGLVAKIDTLTLKLNESKKSLIELQKSVNNLESPRNLWNYLTIGSLILALIAFVMNLLKSNRIEKIVEKIFSDCLALGKRTENLEKDFRSSNQRYMQIGKNSSSNVESRLQYLEKKNIEIINAVNELLKQRQNNSSGEVNTRKDKGTTGQTSFNKIGYARINTSKFFTEILDSKQEACVFSIKFISDNEGVFDILSLDKIKSRNDWQEVIEYHGDCTMEEANDYTLEREGICKKMEDNTTWEVTRKLKIRIRK